MLVRKNQSYEIRITMEASKYLIHNSYLSQLSGFLTSSCDHGHDLAVGATTKNWASELRLASGREEMKGEIREKDRSIFFRDEK